MNLLSVDLLWLLLVLLSMNFITAAIIRTEERYWLPQITIWLLLFGVFLFERILNREEIVQKEIVYRHQTVPDDESNRTATLELENAKATSKMENRLMIRLLGIQSVLAFIFQLFGYRNTGKNQFRSGALSFFFLFFVYIVFEVIWMMQLADTPSPL